MTFPLLVDSDPQWRERERALATRFGFSLTAEKCEPPHLQYMDGQLHLVLARQTITQDFLNGELAHRQRFGRLGKSQLIGRALGLKHGARSVADLTTGLGADSFTFVCLGLEVISVERSPVVLALLQDAYDRLQAARPELVQHWQLVHATAEHYLSERADVPDVIYLDPMFSPAKRKALPNKKMQALESVLGPADSDQDWTDLIQKSLRVARLRVVVKRPRHGPPLYEPVTHQFLGQSVRYDMYLANQEKENAEQAEQ